MKCTHLVVGGKMASTASLIRSSTSFRRQGSSGRVWGEGSFTAMLQAETTPFVGFQNEEDQKSFACCDVQPKLFHSRSTGFIETQQPYFHNHKSGNEQKPDASRKSRFRIAKWIKQILRRSS